MKKKIRIVTVIGARPQFVKAAVVSREFVKHGLIHEIIVHTGQHYDHEMSEVFFKQLGLRRPEYNLGVGSKPHGEQTAAILSKLEPILIKQKPDGVLVYGDTNSTLAGALCASKLHIPVAHVEAGLRSWNRRMPEEINRVVTDHIAGILFCPTDTAVQNLKAEGITRGVYTVGDVMLDAALFFGKNDDTRSTSSRRASGDSLSKNILTKYGLHIKNYFLITLHRAENTDNIARLQCILNMLLELQAPAIFPVHPRLANLLATHPHLRKVNSQLRSRSELRIVQPVSYFEMLSLEKNARAIITDSGGVQKEAFFFQVPCITLRDESEWVETLESGFNTLVGDDRKKFLTAVKRLDKIRTKAATKSQGLALFGNGKASARIARILARSWR